MRPQNVNHVHNFFLQTLESDAEEAFMDTEIMSGVTKRATMFAQNRSCTESKLCDRGSRDESSHQID